MENTEKTKGDYVIEMIDASATVPFVTPRFGNHWKEHTKEKIENGDMSIDDVIHIAWLQGRRALLMEEYIKEHAK